MNKTMKKYMYMMAVALVFAGCSSDDILEDIPEQNPSIPGQTIKVPVRITADGGSPSTRVTGTDTGSQLTFLWESTDGIEVFFGETGMTQNTVNGVQSGAGTNVATFDADLQYNLEANGNIALSSSTILYSYIKNPNTVYNATDKTVTVDLASQTGLLNDALAHTLFWAETTRGTDPNNIHFQYQNKMSVMKFNISNIGTESGTGTVTFIADTGIPNSVTCNAKDGTVTSGTGMYVKATAVTFENGAATAYLAIAPNAATAITKAEVRIDINGKTYWQKFKDVTAGKIEGGKLYPQNIKKAQQLKVGDVLYKDGTWSTREEAVNHNKSEVLGIVGDVNPTQEDIDLGYRHGYAVYYEDLPDGKDYDWASQYFMGGVALYVQHVSGAYSNVTYPSLDIQPKTATQEQIVAALNAEPSGFVYSQTLYPLLCHHLATGLTEANRTAYPATYYAYGEWGEKDGSGKGSGTHSFLATAGQMYKVLTNMGILDTSKNFVNDTPKTSTSCERWYWEGQNYAAEMNNILTITCKDGAYSMNMHIVNDVYSITNPQRLQYYWTTTEDASASEAYSFYLKGGNIVFDAQQKTDKKRVRPLVAF